MIEIADALTPRSVSGSESGACERRPEVEWSALIGVAATIMAAEMGITPSKENLSRIGIRVATVIAEEFDRDFKRGRLLS